MKNIPEIKLFGTAACHKTTFYKTWLDQTKLPHHFLDVAENEVHLETLRNLYESRKGHFPTITIGKKKLRNPKPEELQKWINKLIPEILEITHDKEKQRFTLAINDEIAKVDYQIRDNKMYLMHSEVPYNLRGQGIGKVLVEKTFEQLTKEGYTTVAICSYIKSVAAKSEKWKTKIAY
ncbi:N-acetyltransferase [Lacinutrix himadriensis]|uniref:N-acetyltransferase n=1 Tax=Lacinutrix himadriensis TaxID=641549 RepID=UPI000B0C572B|nr:N-acetyltransferase [Lacinutrix himadriensis]